MNLLILPILIPWLSAMVLALLRGNPRLERAFAIISTAGLTAFVFWLLFHVDANGIQTTVLGGWNAPWGIVLVADRLACIMLCLSCGVGLIALIYSCFTVTPRQQNYFFFPLFQVVLTGVNWSFITGDIFNLFVAYEVMLMGSYGIMMVGASKVQVRQTMKYIAINVVGSTFFVAGVGLIYSTVGAINMAEISQRTAALTGDANAGKAAMVTAVSTVMMIVFAMKTAAFPLFFWLPDSYPVVPSGVNGFFAGLLTKVGVYSLLRMYVVVFRQPGAEVALQIILALSCFTMLLGVLGAMCQWEIRKILSWHIISQVGYMVMGIGLVGIVIYQPDGRTPDVLATDALRTAAVVGTIFYIVHHIVVKSSLFLVGGITERVTGTQELKKMGGVLDLAPGVAGLFLIASFSLAGMPPFSGFLSKFVLVKAGLAGGAYIVVAVAIITSFFTLYSMTKIWSYAFWGKKCRQTAGSGYRALMVPTGVLVAFTVVMGVMAQPFVALAERAAKDVTDPTAYIDASLRTKGQPVKPAHGEHVEHAKSQDSNFKSQTSSNPQSEEALQAALRNADTVQAVPAVAGADY
ncbi:MAG: proton-conducting transporter membrane subunit [Phycisphaeraceae bacterium]